DASLGKLRLLRLAANRARARTEAFEEIGKVARLRASAEEVLQQMDEAVRGEERRRWDERARELRHEATRWLLGIHLNRDRSITLPDGPDAGSIPAVALHPDLKQIAFVYPGTTTVFLLGPDGREQQRLRVPDDIAARALTRQRTISGMPGFRSVN